MTLYFDNNILVFIFKVCILRAAPLRFTVKNTFIRNTCF